MTTITIDQKLKLSKNHFYDLEELLYALYEESLEQKMQNSKKNGIFTDY